MKTIMGICGYRCDLCPVHKSNYENIDKNKLRDGWAKYFNYETEVVERCEGCPKDGNPECKVKSCAQENGINSCGCCPDFACDKLKPVMNVVEDKIKDLSNVPEEDLDLFIRPYMAKKHLSEMQEK